MKSVNKIILIGNLGDDSEFREIAGGKKFMKLRLATKTFGVNRGESVWHSVICWNERITNFFRENGLLKKGKAVYVEGGQEHRKVEATGDFPARYFSEVIVSLDGQINLLEKSEAKSFADEEIPFG